MEKLRCGKSVLRRFVLTKSVRRAGHNARLFLVFVFIPLYSVLLEKTLLSTCFSLLFYLTVLAIKVFLY